MPQETASCPKCRSGEKDWVGGDRNCGFKSPSLEFTPDNWNCEVLNLLRELAQEKDWIKYHEDCSMVSFPVRDVGWVVLTWYKRRGRTDVAQVLTGVNVEPLTYAAALQALRQYGIEAPVHPKDGPVGVMTPTLKETPLQTPREKGLALAAVIGPAITQLAYMEELLVTTRDSIGYSATHAAKMGLVDLLKRVPQ